MRVAYGHSAPVPLAPPPRQPSTQAGPLDPIVTLVISLLEPESRPMVTL